MKQLTVYSLPVTMSILLCRKMNCKKKKISAGSQKIKSQKILFPQLVCSFYSPVLPSRMRPNYLHLSGKMHNGMIVCFYARSKKSQILRILPGKRWGGGYACTRKNNDLILFFQKKTWKRTFMNIMWDDDGSRRSVELSSHLGGWKIILEIRLRFPTGCSVPICVPSHRRRQ